MSQPVAERGKLHQPVRPDGGKQRLQPLAENLGQSRALSACGDGQKKVAAANYRRRVEIAEGNHVLDIDQDAPLPRLTGECLRGLIRDPDNKQHSHTVQFAGRGQGAAQAVTG